MATCAFPACQRHAEKNGYCIGHRIYAPGAKPKDKAFPEKKQPKPINKKSAKLADREKEYKQIVREMLAISNRCELATPDCTGTAQGLHHMKGRGANLLVRKFLKRACNACNGYVERHPAYALEHGLSVSRHQKEA